MTYPKKEPVFTVGQVVEATGSYGYLLTKGKRYVVTKYEPEQYDQIFTWPAYVTGHAHRFRAVEEEPQ